MNETVVINAYIVISIIIAARVKCDLFIFTGRICSEFTGLFDRRIQCSIIYYLLELL